ncbi:MAG TPA: PHP domain-containing protein, partial [Candidatus Luteimonas excrementigallinarum]|nr:PHP domain-containing protein [Candidatus Luteimonas excrementigallinarum]
MAARMVRMSAGYAELHCLSNFSFQRGASSAHELFERAKQHGYEALAITDECTLAGIVRAWQAAKAVGLPLITGSEMRVEGGPKLVLLAENLAGYQALCRIITAARMRAPKGEYRLLREDFDEGVGGLLALWLPDGVGAGAPSRSAVEEEADWLRTLFPDRLWIAVELHRGADDATRLTRLQALGERFGLPLVAAGDVHMHARGRRALQDVMTAIRHHVTVAEAGWRLFPNGERHLRPVSALEALYPPALLEESLRIARRCRFDLGELSYQYP